jgi:hypothetical protein
MVLSELLIDLRKLNRADKLYVIQELVSELVQKEEASIKEGQSYPVSASHKASDAGNIMLRVLEDSNQSNDEVLRKDVALARIRKRWDMLPIQLSDRVQMWKEEGRP